jgi:GntR family transcriptional regulator/MocR family aminotransferase
VYGITIEPGGLSHFKQIYLQIRERILDGRIPRGFKLLSSRRMAQELKVARSLVLEILDQLKVEGFVEGRRGSGYYVQDSLPFDSSRSAAVLEGGTNNSFINQNTLFGGFPYNFAPGLPDPELFPRSWWIKAYKENLDYAPGDSFFYAPGMGHQGLRSSMQNYLLRSKGITESGNRLVITKGTAGALETLCQFLPRARVFVEDPTAPFIPRLFFRFGWEIHRVRVDQEGMTNIDQTLQPGDLIYLTPSHQFPLGGTLSLERRWDFLQKAQEAGAYVIEDDYDSEFRYDARPIAAMQVLMPDQVIYLGSFSKILTPAIHLGYAVFPRPLMAKVADTMKRMEYLGDNLLQGAMARFIESGCLEKHLRKSLNIYRRRREILIEKVEERFSGSAVLQGYTTGLSCILSFEKEFWGRERLQQLQSTGVYIKSAADNSSDRNYPRYDLVLGFGLIDAASISDGMDKIAQSMQLSQEKIL